MLTADASVLLPDEPLEGLASMIAEKPAEAVRSMALVLVEQRAGSTLADAEGGIVERGSIVHRTSSADLLAGRKALERHLGLEPD